MKDIVFFDIETTGLNVDIDQIIQIAAIKISDLGKHIFEAKIKPTVPISVEALSVHKITLDMLADKPLFSEVAESIYNLIEGCDIGGHNVVFFDMQMLVRQLAECGFNLDIESINFVDTRSLYRELYPATLDASYKHITGKDRRENTHDALVDIEDTVELWESMININAEFSTPEKCAELTRLSGIIDLSGKIRKDKETGEILFTFGKNKDKKITKDQGYIDWILRNPDFSISFKNTLKKYIRP